MVSASMILFDTADPARVAAARLAVGELIDAVGEWGAAPYRAHIALVDKVQSRFDYNAHAIGRTYARIKQAFDPAGILSPGNHGIWPERPSS
jgi:4-cresol dehydrogenase (hydroxylating)